MTPKKLIFLLLIIFSTISFIRLLILTSITSDPIHTLLSPLPPLPPPPPPPPTPPSLSSQNHLRLPNPRNPRPIPAESDPLSPKELHLLQTLISIKSPCNLLFFGITPQLLDLAKSNNRGGNTIFLVNEFDRPREIQGIGIGIYRVECEEKSKQSYDLLKYARITPTCRPNDGPVYESRCRLALRGLPEIVNKVRWDVIVVDGPGNGGGPEAPGRMAAIYTAALIARAGNSTDVLVHNVDRTIEKWYSWEFLCSENLVSSKGRLWHFRIRGRSNSGRFCNKPAFKIQ